MENDMSDIINNVKNLVDSGNIPDNLKDIINNLQNSNNNNTTNNITSENNNVDFDINTILKMKSIINAMNKKDDPRTNLLYSLKPYLRDSRKNKLDQYVNMLNITKMADIFKTDNKENNNGI